MNKEHQGFLYAIIAACASALMAVFAKLNTSASVETIVFARFALGLPIVFWIIVHNNVDISLKKVPMHLVRALGTRGRHTQNRFQFLYRASLGGF